MLKQASKNVKVAYH